MKKLIIILLVAVAAACTKPQKAKTNSVYQPRVEDSNRIQY